MPRKPLGKPHFAPDVRVIATREGVIALSANGCFRITGRFGNLFVSELVPELYGPVDRNSKPHGLPDSLTDYVRQLSQVGIVTFSVDVGVAARLLDREVGVVVIRPTLLTDRVIQLLVPLGIRLVDSISESSFAIADLCGLNTDRALQLARELHEAGCRSISIWNSGSEIFYGPLAEPGQTACWNCFRLRFSDSISSTCDDIESRINDELISAKAVADNVLLAIRFPDIVAYGCVVVDGGDASSVHSITSVPWCAVCNYDEAPSEPRSRFVPPIHSLHVPEEFRILADSRGGVVRRILLFDCDGSDAPILPICCTALIAPHSYGNKRELAHKGEGKGATQDDAARSAIGEGVERYAASIWQLSKLIYASFDELGRRAFDPNWLVLYDDDQYARMDFPYVRFDAQQPIYWKCGRWLDTDEEVQLPAIATYLNFPSVDAERFGQTTSSGLAAGSTFEDAALRALYELIERDAFMLIWLAKRPALRVAVDGAEAVTQQAILEAERLGARIELYLIDVGTGHPTMICVGLGDGNSWPAVTIGLGTHANVDIALQKAVFEHGHYGLYMRRLMREGEHKKISDRKDVLTNLDHGLYYIDPEHSSALGCFRADAGNQALLEDLRRKYRHEAKLTACVSSLAEVGVRAAAVDVTPPDIRLSPIRVVRAFGTYMQPIHFGSVNRRLKNPRLECLLWNGVEINPHPIA